MQLAISVLHNSQIYHNNSDDSCAKNESEEILNAVAYTDYVNSDGECRS